MKHLLCLALGLMTLHPEESKVNIYLIGDSTVSTYPDNYYPRMGWGQALGAYFQHEKVQVHNKAVSGRSTKSYIVEGLWKQLVQTLDEGDYLLIQFGHNDMKKGEEHLYAAPFNDYTANLKMFIQEAREKKAYPILVTPVFRRRFDENGLLQNSLGDYALAMRILAEQEQVPLLDLHKRSFELFSKLGAEKTKEIFLWLSPGAYENYPEGIQDNSHFSEKGAQALSALIIDEIVRLELPLKEHMREE